MNVLHVCVSMPHMRLVATEAKEGISSLGTGDKDGRETPCRCGDHSPSAPHFPTTAATDCMS